MQYGRCFSIQSTFYCIYASIIEKYTLINFIYVIYYRLNNDNFIDKSTKNAM